jgi:hypothetical protein
MMVSLFVYFEVDVADQKCESLACKSDVSIQTPPQWPRVGLLATVPAQPGCKDFSSIYDFLSDATITVLYLRSR